ncbi:MAG: anti-sigma factor [Rhodanobacteraceae bacterium]|nr:MAG: anti-sigma factor [Rhodanobacteraceae bacterium]
MNDTRPFPSETDIHAWVDGRMDVAGCVRMEAWLASNLRRAEEIRGWQRDAQQLRAALGGLPPAAGQRTLDPTMIRARRRRRVRARIAMAAVLVLTLGVGMVGGWQARRMAAPAASAPMADALQAYRMFASNRHLNLDVTQHEPGQLQGWLRQHFRNAPRLPDLDGAGFHPVGARLLATDSGPAAMVLYQNAEGGAISFYIRPPSPSHGVLPRGQRRDGQLVATYWSGNGYNYALVSPVNASDVRVIREAAFPPSI